DGVIIGGNTVRLDNPYLTTHQVSDRNPLRVVLSPSFNLPSVAILWDTETANTLVFTQPNPDSLLKKQLQDQGVEIIELETLNPLNTMKILYERGLSTVLWECGGNLAAKAITDGVVQKIMAFIAPKMIGGETAPSPIGDLNLTQMTDALTLQRVKLQQIAQDWLIEGYL
ncbi:MAG: dihydrofolate reductase family protein, partial [Microcystaceae cyanobacterium]